MTFASCLCESAGRQDIPERRNIRVISFPLGLYKYAGEYSSYDDQVKDTVRPAPSLSCHAVRCPRTGSLPFPYPIHRRPCLRSADLPTSLGAIGQDYEHLHQG